MLDQLLSLSISVLSLQVSLAQAQVSQIPPPEPPKVMIMKSITPEIHVKTEKVPRIPEKVAKASIPGKIPTKFSELGPIMTAVAVCESGGTHIRNGRVIRGRTTPADVGLMQINTLVHLSQAKRLGYDVFSESGNIAYALYLYKTQGLSPWSASYSCMRAKGVVV